MDAAPIGTSIMELSSRHDMTQEERGKLRRTLSRRLSSLAKRVGSSSAAASALGESMLGESGMVSLSFRFLPKAQYFTV